MPGMDWDEVEKRLKREAEAEEKAAQAGRDRKMDDAFMGDFMYLTGMDPSDIRKYGEDIPDIDLDQAMRVIKKGKREYEKGNRKKGDKIIKADKNAAAVAKEAGRKGKGCAVVTLIGLALTVYGAVVTAQWGYELVALAFR